MAERRIYVESTAELSASLSALEANLAKDAELKNGVDEKEQQLKDYLSVKEKIERIEKYALHLSLTLSFLGCFSSLDAFLP